MQAPGPSQAFRPSSAFLIYAYDVAPGKAAAFAATLESELRTRITAVTALAAAVAVSDIVITCTTAHRFFITREMVRPGTFVAGVGADNEDNQELDPALLAHATLVTDLRARRANWRHTLT